MQLPTHIHDGKGNYKLACQFTTVLTLGSLRQFYNNEN